MAAVIDNPVVLEDGRVLSNGAPRPGGPGHFRRSRPT
jgi:hypothetical protein